MVPSLSTEPTLSQLIELGISELQFKTRLGKILGGSIG